ncbi:MAG: acyl-CoA dehydratase activase [Candidatus Eisenbacteria bacterium]
MSGIRVVAGIDVGTECVKVIVMRDGGDIIGRSVVPTRGRFEDCAQEALAVALDEAQIRLRELAALGATGFGARCVTPATHQITETACHARGAFHHFPHPMTLVDVGGRDPNVIRVDEQGYRTESRSVRRCAIGIGTFLMFAARHLDVHPTRLEELAAGSDEPVRIGSYCSVFSGSDVLERLREGASPGQVAAGCIRSVAERVHEIGNFADPLVLTGGVLEYFPGVARSLEELSGVRPKVVPEPITAGAIGAALFAFEPATESVHSA